MVIASRYTTIPHTHAVEGTITCNNDIFSVFVTEVEAVHVVPALPLGKHDGARQQVHHHPPHVCGGGALSPAPFTSFQLLLLDVLLVLEVRGLLRLLLLFDTFHGGCLPRARIRHFMGIHIFMSPLIKVGTRSLGRTIAVEI